LFQLKGIDSTVGMSGLTDVNFLKNLNLYKIYIPIDKLTAAVGINTDNKIINVESVEVSGSEVCNGKDVSVENSDDVSVDN
jgi:hypothetical protein